MIDFYRKSVLSQWGKDAGNLSVLDYVRKTTDKYNKYLSEIKDQKKNLDIKKKDNELYL